MTRRRRRILIPATVVAVVVGAYWLLMPRVDPRFVGTWTPADRVEPDWLPEFVFRADGQGERIRNSQMGYIIVPTGQFRWRVSNNPLRAAVSDGKTACTTCGCGASTLVRP